MDVIVGYQNCLHWKLKKKKYKTKSQWEMESVLNEFTQCHNFNWNNKDRIKSTSGKLVWMVAWRRYISERQMQNLSLYFLVLCYVKAS